MGVIGRSCRRVSYGAGVRGGGSLAMKMPSRGNTRGAACFMTYENSTTSAIVAAASARVFTEPIFACVRVCVSGVDEKSKAQ